MVFEGSLCAGAHLWWTLALFACGYDLGAAIDIGSISVEFHELAGIGFRGQRCLLCAFCNALRRPFTVRGLECLRHLPNGSESDHARFFASSFTFDRQKGTSGCIPVILLKDQLWPARHSLS